MEKWPIFDQNHGLKPNFFEFFNFLFLKSGKAFFLSRIFSNTFPWPFLPILNRLKNFQFLTKIMDLSLWKNGNVSTFIFLLLLSGKGVFFFVEYSQLHFPGLFCL